MRGALRNERREWPLAAHALEEAVWAAELCRHDEIDRRGREQADVRGLPDGPELRARRALESACRGGAPADGRTRRPVGAAVQQPRGDAIPPGSNPRRAGRGAPGAGGQGTRRRGQQSRQRSVVDGSSKRADAITAPPTRGGKRRRGGGGSHTDTKGRRRWPAATAPAPALRCTPASRRAVPRCGGHARPRGSSGVRAGPAR